MKKNDNDYDYNTGLVLSGGGARGAYEIGAYEYMLEKGMNPGIIAGSSVGAINGAAIASGMTVDQIKELWLSIRNKNVFRVSITSTIKGFFKPTMSAFFDTAPLRKLLLHWLDFEKIQKSKVKLFITAVDVTTGTADVFTNKEITVDHILASASIPILFPWTKVNDKFYWDGGITANTPIVPVLNEGAKNIYTVLLSPRSAASYKVPSNKVHAIENLLDFVLLSSFETVFYSLKPEKKNAHTWKIGKGTKKAQLHLIEPSDPMGVISFLNFSKSQARKLLARGYKDAKKVLR